VFYDVLYVVLGVSLICMGLLFFNKHFNIENILEDPEFKDNVREFIEKHTQKQK
jgi:sulfite exporter TauE/SafE